MRRRTRDIVIGIAGLLTLGCGDEGPDDELTYAELVGNYALISLVFTADADSDITFDFRAASGSGSLTFTPDTTFQLVLVPNPGSPSEAVTGPVELDGETIILTDETDPDLPLFTGRRSGTQLVFETEDAEYDFDGDGTEEPARVDAVFEP
jgi:hypothetical protein